MAAGHWYADAALGDDDLAPLRDDPRFGELAAASAANRRAYEHAIREPLVVAPAGASQGSVVAFHRAAGSPGRTRPHWEAAVADGWRLVLPWAEHAIESNAHVWLDAALQRLDHRAIRRVGRALDVSEPPVILAGFSQGAAAALLAASEGALPAAAVLVVGSTARYLEAIDRGGPSPGLTIHFVIGAEERHVAAAREAARELEARGAEVTVDVRPGLGHAFPVGWDAELPGLLAGLRRPPPPR